ncbi:bifunctional riboflavin kinase/FAD synthetase [Buchnera aphidicola (Macrosiphoniella sanborni)]|uniref:Riboflavin biosynthesis protein n=1 Tax=Buchnera aphidicola (Macrosiphoniella sanborni) TaxID=1241865 RepID=A0A4D6YH91_9GAMM|nr:bifunctional riboflavin kinase/FAD synthetase [Buchnera aphidicola]QCI23705.1 bifunctional riboflavin kinase/FAD synthetase [Buchnera aphidicola (Macrosiphoniella sanborni)]
MKIIRGIHNIQDISFHSVITIGKFDGIHLGHQKLFLKTYKISAQYKLLSIVILFEPQPLEFFKKNNSPIRITKFREKVKWISSYNIDKILCIRFNQSFKSVKPQDFITNILINKLHMKFIVIGNDFRFGFNRNGNIELLKKLGDKYKFSIIKIRSLYKKSMKISSTNIRKALSKNNIKLANNFLGRQFSISGKVIHGDKLARTINYPTANIRLDQKFLLNHGVYAVKIKCSINKNFLGISNIGVKPTFMKNTVTLLEVHLFNTNIDLYGKYIEVFIYKKIRDEQLFSSKEELKNQIFQDIIKVKKYFKIS